MLTLELLDNFLDLDKYGREYAIAKHQKLEHISFFMKKKFTTIRELVKSKLYDENITGKYLCGIDFLHIEYGFQIVTFYHNDYEQLLEFGKAIDQVTRDICINIWGNIRDKPNDKGKMADELYCNRPSGSLGFPGIK
ncbi:hypothetical protein [Flexithrix dorotheae]|uniref:hypothetical protein n=1 Tax=Flexithrix dorotheae TaxID=70993 RepID=UPI00037BD456|nr:hypothetical protein [Flexithrix dorotheae]